MRRLILMASILGSLLIRAPAGAGLETPQVVGNGGGALTGAGHRISGSTLGLPAIGPMTGSLFMEYAGFWVPTRFLTGVEEADLAGPWEYRLGPCYPNPFNPVTTVGFSVPDRCRVTLRLYDVRGREVMTVVDEDVNAGRYARVLDAEGLATGLYVCQMVAGRFVATQKIMLLK